MKRFERQHHNDFREWEDELRASVAIIEADGRRIDYVAEGQWREETEFDPTIREYIRRTQTGSRLGRSMNALFYKLGAMRHGPEDQARYTALPESIPLISTTDTPHIVTMYEYIPLPESDN